MDAKAAIKSIRALLGFSEAAKFEDAKLSDGTLIQYSTLEAGGEIFVVDEAGTQTPAPAGDHELEDGRIVVITEPGIIAEVKEATPPPEEEQKMEETATDYSAQIKSLQDENAQLKTQISTLQSSSTKFGKALGEITDLLQLFAEQDTDEAIKKPRQTVFSEKEEAKAAGKAKFQKGFQAFKQRLNEAKKK